MRRIIFASHYKFAFGLKETVKYILNDSQKSSDIYEISAYTENGYDLGLIVKSVFQSFNKDDEIVILTDILFGSVNQAFLPYISEHCHLIAGANVALALEILLYPEDEALDKKALNKIVNSAKEQIVYMNVYEAESLEEDE